MKLYSFNNYLVAPIILYYGRIKTKKNVLIIVIDTIILSKSHVITQNTRNSYVSVQYGRCLMRL